jgi:hypothetical protein
MINNDKLDTEFSNTKEIFKENLIVIVVLIFSFIYFLFQFYAWLDAFFNG